MSRNSLAPWRPAPTCRWMRLQRDSRVGDLIAGTSPGKATRRDHIARPVAQRCIAPLPKIRFAPERGVRLQRARIFTQETLELELLDGAPSHCRSVRRALQAFHAAAKRSDTVCRSVPGARTA